MGEEAKLISSVSKYCEKIWMQRVLIFINLSSFCFEFHQSCNKSGHWLYLIILSFVREMTSSSIINIFYFWINILIVDFSISIWDKKYYLYRNNNNKSIPKGWHKGISPPNVDDITFVSYQPKNSPLLCFISNKKKRITEKKVKK